MTWTKGNKQGEWEVITDGQRYTGQDGYETIDGKGVYTDFVTTEEKDGVYEAHIFAERIDVHCEECGNDTTVDSQIVFANKHDIRLAELMPRMADALVDMLENTYMGRYGGDPAKGKDHVDLMMELAKLKAGE